MEIVRVYPAYNGWEKENNQKQTSKSKPKGFLLKWIFQLISPNKDLFPQSGDLFYMLYLSSTAEGGWYFVSPYKHWRCSLEI